jgi:hypothetical protein
VIFFVFDEQSFGCTLCVWYVYIDHLSFVKTANAFYWGMAGNDLFGTEQVESRIDLRLARSKILLVYLPI